MIKKWLIGFLSVWMLCGFIISANADNRYPKDIQKIIDRGYLKVAMFHFDEPPFFMIDKKTGELIGSDVTLAKAIAKSLGVTVKFDRSYKTFDAIVQGVADDKADLAVSELSQNLERAKKVKFTPPYIQMRMGMVINRLLLAKLKTSDSLTNTLNQARIKIGVMKDSAYVSIAKELFKNAQLVELETAPELFDEVKEGKIIAYIDNEMTLKSFMLKYTQEAVYLKYVFFEDVADNIAIAVPSTSSQLLYYLQFYLAKYAKHLSVDKIISEYKPYLTA